ncbi:hypothetical protein F5890DRAFT_1559736 [Lentinula detonsa]|uniref:Uncharacterized protein n=1 Tax=Lentinula detonsa TaxID=2804962 RepID=A0AA38PND1_9AGAR|nr:hypothetical protein F5890DRAFT_1559736 [Lentinula detonsa]
MSQQQDIQSNSNDDLSRLATIQFGDFHESPNTQNAPLGANSTAGTPAFNHVSGPGFPGPFGGGSQLPPNQHALFGAPMNTGVPVFQNTPSPGFQGQAGGSSQPGPNFTNANSHFSSPFTGQNSYASTGANYPYHSLHPPTHMQQVFPPQMQNPIASYGYPMPMMAPQGQSTMSPSSTSLRITVGNIITHSDNCPMCMGYVAHLITASDFNDIISERDGNIRGEPSSLTNSQGRELVVSSLQEQLASTSRAHETERQNLQDRITALELERNELRARHESDMAQIDDIVRNCQEAHDRRQYWKAQYYDLRDQEGRQDAKASPTVAVAKKLDKGKGKEVSTVPLQTRITTSLPLSQRLSPMEGDSNSQGILDNTRASGSGQHAMSGQAGTSLSGGSVSTTLPPHTGDKRKRDPAPASIPQRGTVSYDNLYAEPTGEVQYSYKAYQVEHYLTDMEDDYSEPEAHPNQLKGKQREMQNKINREARWQMDAVKNKEFDVLRGMVTKLPFQDPTSVEEVERIVKTLEESDSVRPWRPLWKTVHGMIAMHKRARHVPQAERSAVDDAVIDRFTTVPQWYIAEMNRQGHTVPKLFEPKPSQKKARHAAAGASLYEAGPSNVASTSATTDGEVMADVPTSANGTVIERFPAVLERRVWRGRRENDSVLQCVDSILSSPASDRLNGMLVESIQDSPTTNTRSIRGMLAVFRLLPNNTGNGVLTDGESNLLSLQWDPPIDGVPASSYIPPWSVAGLFPYLTAYTQQLSLPTTGQSAAPITTDDEHLGGEPPSIVDWDDTQFNAEGDPVIDYGEDDGMNMAG